MKLTAALQLGISAWAAASGIARADDPHGAPRSGKEAAHAALADGAALPTTRPELPIEASVRARPAQGETAPAKKGEGKGEAKGEDNGDAMKAAHAQAGQHAAHDASDAHADAAVRAAQASVQSAARNANADSHAAAGQARAAAARAKAPGHGAGKP